MRRYAMSTVQRSGLRGCIAFCLALCALASFAQSEPVPSDLQQKQVHLSAKRQPFSAYIRELSKQIGRSILADDLPLLQQADMELHGTAKEALDRVSDRFDFTWALSKHGIILMRKRFRNPNEFPQINLPELKQTTKSVLSALWLIPDSMNSGAAGWAYAMKDLVSAFTPDQANALRDGK